MVHEIEKVDDRKCKHAGLGMIVRRGLHISLKSDAILFLVPSIGQQGSHKPCAYFSCTYGID